MYLHTIIVPKNFAEGPQFDEDGNLIPSSWPPGLGVPSQGLKGWHAYGMEKGSRFLVDVIVEDVDKGWIDGLPGGWTKNSNMYWDGITQHGYDENGQIIGNAYEVETPVDEAEYTTHIPPPVDENGNPTGDSATYNRMHGYLGHPHVISFVPEIDPV